MKAAAETEKQRWERETLEPTVKKNPETKKRFESVSLEEVNRLYTPADISDQDFAKDIAFPGELDRDFRRIVKFPRQTVLFPELN